MRVVVVTAAAEEPVSLTEAKLHLRIDVDDDDTLLAMLISAARGVFEATTGRTLVTTTHRAEWDFEPCGREIQLPNVPLASVTWIKYLDADGEEQTMSTADYTVDTGLDVDRPGRVWLNADAEWPTLGDFPSAFRCQYVAGYGDADAVPAEIKACLLLLIAHLYEQRTPIVTGTIATEIPFTLKTLIDMHTVSPLRI